MLYLYAVKHNWRDTMKMKKSSGNMSKYATKADLMKMKKEDAKQDAKMMKKPAKKGKR